jgi:hypothetical protein
MSPTEAARETVVIKIMAVLMGMTRSLPSLLQLSSSLL